MSIIRVMIFGGIMKRRIYIIILFFFIQGIIHNLGHPVTPAFVRGLEIPDYMFGVFFSAMSLGLMIGGPIWGVLGDRGHQRLYAMFGLTIYSVAQFFFGYIGSSFWMVIFRLIAGLGVVSALTIMTGQLIAYSDIKDRAKHLAYAAAASTLGASLGYFLGGFLSKNPHMISLLGTSDLRVIFLIQALLNMGYVGLIFWLYQEDTMDPQHALSKTSMMDSLKNLTKIDKSLLIFLISLTFMTIGSINLSKYIDVYFDELGYDPQQLGTYVMVTGIASLLASIFLVPLFAKVKRQLSFIGISHVMASIIIFYVFRGSNFLLMMYTFYMVYVVIKTIYTPLEQSYIAKNILPGQYGATMGLRQSFVSFGMVIGPLIGGFVYDQKPLWLFDFSAIAFLIGVLLLFGVYLLETGLTKKRSN